MSGYEVCILYKALKLHFTTKYDFIKYRGKVNYDVDQFHKNNSKYFYEKLAKKYNKKEAFNFLLANFIENENIWIKDLVSNIESYESYIRFEKRQQSLSYIVESELKNIFDNDNLFSVTDGNFPLLLKLYLRKEVSIETIIIMNDFMDFISIWDKKIKDDFVWPTTRDKILKYSRLLNYDQDKFKTLLKKIVKENL